MTEVGLSDQGMQHAEQGGRKAGTPGRKPRSTQIDMSDERLDDERGQNEREIYEDRESDEADYLDMFLATQHQTVLPDLPRMDGFHVCWLTTANARDSIQWRQSIGYELIRVEDCPEWRGVGSQVGNYSGVIGVNEMVAARIPMTLYDKYMKAVGHYLPMAEEEKLRAQTNLIRDRARARNIEVQEGDGTADIVQRAAPPVFTE